MEQNAFGRIYRVVCAAFPTHVCEQNVACSNVCVIPVDQLVWILGTPFEMVFWVGIRETNATRGENNATRGDFATRGDLEKTIK